jgi:hypothetical protein
MVALFSLFYPTCSFLSMQLSYLVVDEMHAEHPELIKDAYWDEYDIDLPYTLASESYRPTSPFLGSAINIQ